MKDEDNAAWVMTLDPGVRGEWLRRIRWIRLVDRLAENEWFEPEARRFGALIDSFEKIRRGAPVDPACPHADVLCGMRDDWRGLPCKRLAALAMNAWDDYLRALLHYHHPAISIATVEEHDDMLLRLSGRIFQLVPFLTEEAWDAAGEFGRLDQFFNNLRDLEEDGACNVCYFPADVLARFGLTTAEVSSGRCIGEPGYERLMRYWLDERLPLLRERAEAFVLARDLHPSLDVMRHWTLQRHARIERVFREEGFDFRRFRVRYWGEVRSYLAVAAASR